MLTRRKKETGEGKHTHPHTVRTSTSLSQQHPGHRRAQGTRDTRAYLSSFLLDAVVVYLGRAPSELDVGETEARQAENVGLLLLSLVLPPPTKALFTFSAAPAPPYHLERWKVALCVCIFVGEGGKEREGRDEQAGTERGGRGGELKKKEVRKVTIPSMLALSSCSLAPVHVSRRRFSATPPPHHTKQAFFILFGPGPGAWRYYRRAKQPPLLPTSPPSLLHALPHALP